MLKILDITNKTCAITPKYEVTHFAKDTLSVITPTKKNILNNWKDPQSSFTATPPLAWIQVHNRDQALRVHNKPVLIHRNTIGINQNFVDQMRQATNCHYSNYHLRRYGSEAF